MSGSVASEQSPSTAAFPCLTRLLAAKESTNSALPRRYERIGAAGESARCVVRNRLGAVTELHRRGEMLHITSQNLVEFLNVATRPLANNGLELSPPDACQQLLQFEATFPLLAETEDIHPQWKALVSALGVMGKQVHDARLVAVCRVHGVSQVLTFNTAHFVRLGTVGPAITAVHPQDVQSVP